LLDPVLEHDDAQSGADGIEHAAPGLPCLRAEKPLVGTGIERTVAVDSGTRCRRCAAAVVDYVDASRIVVRVTNEETSAGEVGVDIYNLVKYTRSNQNTNITSVRS